MPKTLLLLLAGLLPLLFTACAGTRGAASAGTVVTVGTLMDGSSIMAQQSPAGRSWSVEVEGGEMILTVDGVSAVFQGATISGAVKYQFDSATSTWNFLLNGGAVHWRGDEVRVGDTTHDLSVPGEFVFTPEDWKKAE